MIPKDFTPIEARSWVRQERAKHKTHASIMLRIASEKRSMEMFAAPDFAAISAKFPNSNQAHRNLVAVLEADLVALEAREAALDAEEVAA